MSGEIRGFNPEINPQPKEEQTPPPVFGEDYPPIEFPSLPKELREIDKSEETDPDLEVEEPSFDRGIYVQENDRVASANIRGENLSDEEFEKRAESIKELRTALLDWVQENVPDDKWDQRKLKAMTNFLSSERAGEIKEITRYFLDKNMYPMRPVVKLMMREIGSIPDVYLFGWRGKDPEQWERETKIHDHADSTVALTVHEGVVDETVYVVDASDLKTVGTRGLDNPRGSQRIKLRGQKTKSYPVGASKTYKSPPPYLHTVAGSPNEELTITVHAYLRPSEEVAYDFAIDAENGELVEVGVS